MSASLRSPMTLAEFLAWEERQELRYEFDGLCPVAMVGGTQEHHLIQANLTAILHGRLRGKPCRVFGDGMKIQVAGRIRYPDALIVCSKHPRGTTVFADPVVVFEVISPSTAGTDRIVKNQEYWDTPSILRYVMLEQDFAGAMVLHRDGAHWAVTVVSGDGVIALPEIGIALPLAELYEGVELPEPGE